MKILNILEIQQRQHYHFIKRLRIKIKSWDDCFAAFGGGFTWGAAYLTWAY